MNRKGVVITGIGTDVGKTVVSAIVAQALWYDYWKPVQAGDLDNSDSKKVAVFTNNITILPERYRLTVPASPHFAAAQDQLTISPNDFQLPHSQRPILVEGAGGLLVPLNNQGLVFADLVSYWNLPVIVVSRHYLGSINHTLLTMEALKSRNISVAGIVFVGDENQATESIILSKTGVKFIARIPIVNVVDAEFVNEQANRIAPVLKSMFHE
ncbi:MAG: dethiobiotin synthase [Flavobacteriia bacterium]|jgi:dethiobiotin synthetase